MASSHDAPKSIYEQLLSDKYKTFQYDEELPSLPVPPLSQTLERYLTSVKPFCTEEEFLETQRKVNAFRVGVGLELHEKLLERGKKYKNWLEEWWLKYAYLSVRNPILPLLNMSGPQFLNLDVWPPSEATAVQHCAEFVWVTLDFFLNLRKQRVAPQLDVKGQRLSMDQFRRLFNTCRIPQEGFDRLATYWKTEEEGSCPNNAIILCNGHIWSFVPFDSSGEPFTPFEIEKQLLHVQAESRRKGRGPGIPALTCDHRDSWAKNRAELQSLCKQNSDNLEKIESSMFVVVLDEYCPKDFQDAVWQGLCGDPTCRWADKSFVTVVHKNGYGSSNSDHSPSDAMVSAFLFNYLYSIVLEKWQGDWPGERTVRKGLPMPTMLDFVLSSSLHSAIHDSKKVNKKLTDNIVTQFYVFPGYGKDWIRSNKIYPDALIQMSFQLSYFRMHKKIAPTYETATTRQFYHARTETLRSCTLEAKNWMESMVDPLASKTDQYRKFSLALETHGYMMSECRKNQGVDRHLLGLQILCFESGMDIPDIFLDSSYTKSGGGGNYVLSTSTTGYSPMIGGVAPMVPDGYGLFYSILPDRIQFYITCFRDSEETCVFRFSQHIEKAFEDIQVLLEETNTSHL